MISNKISNNNTAKFAALIQFMKKLFYAIAVISGAFLFSCSDSNTPASDALLTEVLKDSSKFTTIEWADTVINFGTVTKGEKVHITFKCKNAGNKPLYIANVHPGCGCTVASFTESAIPPGGSGEVNAEYNSNYAQTPIVRKILNVTTNSLNNCPVLAFTGEVKDTTASNKIDTTK